MGRRTRSDECRVCPVARRDAAADNAAYGIDAFHLRIDHLDIFDAGVFHKTEQPDPRCIGADTPKILDGISRTVIDSAIRRARLVADRIPALVVVAVPRGSVHVDVDCLAEIGVSGDCFVLPLVVDDVPECLQVAVAGDDIRVLLGPASGEIERRVVMVDNLHVACSGYVDAATQSEFNPCRVRRGLAKIRKLQGEESVDAFFQSRMERQDGLAVQPHMQSFPGKYCAVFRFYFADIFGRMKSFGLLLQNNGPVFSGKEFTVAVFGCVYRLVLVLASREKGTDAP